MKDYRSKSLFPLGLSFLLFFNGSLPLAFAQNPPARIDVVVVKGEGVTSSIRQRVSEDPVVRVEDDDHQPVAGAVVVFALPVSGASGEFASGSKTLNIVTDKTGVAVAHGLKTNDVPGKLQIYVTASYRGQRARALINQLITAPAGAKTPTPETHTAKSSGAWKWILLGVAAGGGAGAAFYFKNRNSSSSTSAISISAGAVTFGSPR